MIAGYEIADFLAWDGASWDRLLTEYNADIWPIQVIALGLLVASLWASSKSEHRVVQVSPLIVLAICWAWVGWYFHIQQHAQLNWAAHYWAYACGVQSGLLLVAAIIRAPATTSFRISRVVLVLLVLAIVLPALAAIVFTRASGSLPWPLVDPNSLAWISLLISTAMFALPGKRYLGLMLFVIPVFLLLLSGLIAYALNEPDGLFVVTVAILTWLILLKSSLFQRPDEPEFPTDRNSPGNKH